MARYARRKDGRYQANIVVGLEPQTGKYKYRTIYADTIAELERKKAEIKADLSRGVYSDDEGYTVMEWGRQWLKIYKSSVEKSTYLGYENTINKHMAIIGDIRLKDLKKTDIQMAINALNGHYESQRRLRLTINQMLECAIDDGLVSKNVCRRVELPHRPRSEKRALTNLEKKAIERCTEFTPKEKLFVYLLLYTGMRRGEVLALTQNDIDLKRDLIDVNKAVGYGKNQAYPKHPKTDSGYRTIDILSPLKPLLRDYLKELDTIYLFPDSKGQIMSKTVYRRFWDRIYRKLQTAAGYQGAGPNPIDGLTPHIFRHNFATMLYYAGVDVKEAQRILGHSDSRTTIEIYTHLDQEQSKSKNKLENFIAM